MNSTKSVGVSALAAYVAASTSGKPTSTSAICGAGGVAATPGDDFVSGNGVCMDVFGVTASAASQYASSSRHVFGIEGGAALGLGHWLGDAASSDGGTGVMRTAAPATVEPASGEMKVQGAERRALEGSSLVSVPAGGRLGTPSASERVIKRAQRTREISSGAA